MMRVRSVLIAGFGAFLLAVPAARASYDPLASGRATIFLSPSFRSLLRRDDLDLSGRKVPW